MTPEEVRDSVQNVITEINTGAGIASVFLPQFTAFIAIGKAVDQLIPGLAETVTRWVQGQKPTQDEVDDMMAKLAVLGDSDLP